MNYMDKPKPSKAMPTDKAYGPSGAPAPVMRPKSTVGLTGNEKTPPPVTRMPNSKVGL